MKKIMSIILTCILFFSFPLKCFAAEIQEERTGFQSDEVKQGEVQRVFIYDSKLDFGLYDLKSAELTIGSVEEQAIIKGIKSSSEKYYFEFAIDLNFQENDVWQILGLVLVTNDGERKEISITGDEFRVIDNKLAENLQSAKVLSEETAVSNNRSTYPTVSNVEVVKDNGRFTIKAKVSSSTTRVSFPTWTSRNGQDDIKWKDGIIEGETVSFIVDSKDHNFEIGVYNIHIYAYDVLGNKSVIGVQEEMSYSVPAIKNVQVRASSGSYTITADINGYDIEKVQFPTWTSRNGQDDIKWVSGNVVNGKIEYTVQMNEHNNETGQYNTHIYVYDAKGNKSVFGVSHNMTVDKPTISNVKVTPGNGTYTLTAEVNGYNLSKVSIPTWTDKNAQDDIKWYEVPIVNNKITLQVNAKNHNSEMGFYHSQIFLTDVINNSTKFYVLANMTYSKPYISNVKIIGDNYSFTISGEINGDNVGKIQIPTWTEENGQDDIIWGDATIIGNTFTYEVKRKQHKNEYGNYIAHIYLNDIFGNNTVTGVSYNLTQKKPAISNVQASTSAGKYTIKATVKNTKTVKFPTWTSKNGQDDITWGIGTISGNEVTYTVDMKDHKYETGNYITHIYLYDEENGYFSYALNGEIINKEPIISDVKVSDITSQGYLVTCTITDDYALSHVRFPTWTTENGQDDITWGNGAISGNSVSYRVYVKDHKYNFGGYQTHIYAYDKAGVQAAVRGVNVDINSTSTAGWDIVNGHKYLYDAKGSIVGSGMLVVDISEHNKDINWTAVKNAGVDGVILRSSYGFRSDFTQRDLKFEKNVSELNRLGIPYGIYHFSYATDVGDGLKEAEYALKCMSEAGARPTLPIYYDLEYDPYVGEKSKEFYTQITKEFTSRIRSSGYKVGVYASYDWWTNKLTDPSFDNYEKWVAHYGSAANSAAGTANPNWHPSNKYKIWQYTSSGQVNGIKTKVDMNILFNR